MKWEVEIGGNFVFVAAHYLDKLIRGVLWVACHKANEEVTGKRGYTREKLGKIYIRVIGVYVLTEEGYFLYACGNKLAALLQYCLTFAAAFPAPYVRDYAVGAEVVAAVHYRNPRLMAVPAHGRHTFYYITSVLTENEAALALSLQSVDKLGNTVEHIGLCGKADVMEVPLKLVRYVRLCRHTAYYTDYKVGIFLFLRLKCAKEGKSLHFRMLTDSAGIDYNKVTALVGGGRKVAHILCHTAYALAVRLVLLTAEGDNVVVHSKSVYCFAHTAYIFRCRQVVGMKYHVAFLLYYLLFAHLNILSYL